MGRRRKPDDLREAQGNPGKRPLRAQPAAQTEAVAAAEIADDVPENLGETAAQLWRTVRREIADFTFVREPDRFVLARYCEHAVAWWRYTETLRDIEPHYETESRHGKMVRLHPLVAARDRIEARLVELEDRLGLNPRARQQIMLQLAAMPGAAPGDPLFPGQPDAPAAGTSTPKPSDPDGGSVDSPIGFLLN